MQPVLNANVYGVSTDLPYWELCKNAVEFVYFIQVYRFRGTDITVWRQLSDGRFDQFVAATGPVMLGPVVHQSQSLPPQSGGEMSSEDRVLWCLRGVTPELIRKSIQQTAHFQVHKITSVTESTFQEVCNIAWSVRHGCNQQLGTERDVRVLAQYQGNTIDANSCNGTEDRIGIFGCVNKLLMIAGIQNLPLQQIPIVVEE